MFQMKFNDFLENKTESIFSHREESELMEAKKKIKNALVSCILNRNCLSKREVEVYKLFYYKGYSHREIGKILSIEKTTSRNYLCKANKKLNKISRKLEEL